MSFSRSDLAEDTDYERFVIGRLGTHRIRLTGPSSIFHLESSPHGGGSIVDKAGGASMGGRRVEALREALQPLGFAAAYKVLDMLIEHVLRANGAATMHVRRFDQKNHLLATTPGVLPAPLDRHPELWDRVTALYAEFQDARHAVTHRRAQATRTGGLEVHGDQRQVTDSLTSAEIAAFAAAVHVLVELVIEECDDTRRIEIVAWHLNSLQPRHGKPPLPATDPTAGRRLLKTDLRPAEGRVAFDVARARETIEGQAPSFWDLELLHTGGRVFVGRWEDVPDQAASLYEFDPASPPGWLDEQVGGT